MKKTFLVGFILVAVAVSAFGQERFVRPVDNAKSDPSFLAFRTKLIAAAEKKDANAILAVIDPKIKNGFGGDDGIANFKKQWKITVKNSEFWAEFLLVIKNGGSFSKEGNVKMFVAPYTFSDWPDDIDGFEHMVIFGNNVNLREGPSTDSRVIEQLSYNIVKIDPNGSILDKKVMPDDDGSFKWYKLSTLGGKTGFVAAEFVRSSIDFRAGFEKKRGVWKMTFFLAGD